MFQEVCHVTELSPPRSEPGSLSERKMLLNVAKVFARNPCLVESLGIPYPGLPATAIVTTLRANKDAALRLVITENQQETVRHWRGAYIGFRLYVLRQRRDRRTEPAFLRYARAL